MSNDDSNSAPQLKAGYIISMILLTVGSFVLYSFAPTAIAFVLNRPMGLNDIYQNSVPIVEHAALARGKLYVPYLKIDPFNPGVSQPGVTVFDLETTESKEIEVQAPSQINLVADETGLWGVSGANVIRIEGDQVTQTPTGTTLGREPIFIYEGKLATILDSSKGSKKALPDSHLWVWTGSTWQNEGQVVLPRIIDEEAVGADITLPNAVVPKSFKGATKIKVVSENGRTHLFCSDGTTVLYSSKLEIIPSGAASALATENAPSRVSNWISAGNHKDFQVGVDKQGLLLAENQTDIKNLGMRTTSTVMRLVDGVWTQQFQTERPGFVIDPQLVSDGQQAFIVNQSINNKLVLADVESKGTNIVKLPMKNGVAMERLTLSIQNFWWLPLLVLLAYAAIAGRLMRIYCNSRYDYGNATVELAPFFRRTLAKGVDWMLISGPFMALQRIYLGTQADAQEWWNEVLGSMDMNVLKMLILGATAVVIYFFVWLIGLGILEGKWGVSPGKWLCGLRVVRTTLKPSGFFRAVLREIFLLIDAVMCCGWLPGVFTIAFSRCHQRLGDLIADTIVIRKPVLSPIPNDMN